MKSMKILLPALFLIIPITGEAADGERFLSKVKLPSGQTVVVAEGDYEARSIGSYSLRLYEKAEPGDETTFFKSGIVNERDGTLEKVILNDINGDKKEELIVTARSAGSGDYLSAQAFTINDGSFSVLTSVEGIAPSLDIIAELKAQLKPSGKRG